MGAAAAASLLVVLAAGCGGSSGDGEALFRRLELAPAADAAPVGDERSVSRFEPVGERGRWTLDAEHHGMRRLVGADKTAPPALVYAHSYSGESPVAFVRKGRYDPSLFNHARVAVTFEGNGLGYLRVRLRRQGEEVVRSEPTVLTDTLDPQAFEVHLPKSDSVLCDELVIDVAGGQRNVGLLAVDLVDRPLSLLVPDAAGAPELVEHMAETRPAEGLSHDRPVEVSFDVPAGGRLAFAHAAPNNVRRRSSASARLRVLVRDVGDPEDPGVELVRKPRMYWEHTEIDLAAYAGRRMTARFEVVPAPLHPSAEDAVDGIGTEALEPGKRERLLAGFAGGWVVAEAALVAGGGGPPPPTVLLVTTDTHRGDHVGYATVNVGVATPALDLLAARGTVFEDCFAPTNVTNPSHIALLTGIHPRDTGVVVNRRPLTDTATTLAERFRDAGWATHAVITARHLGHPSSGLGQGFDRMNWPRGGERSATEAVDIALDWSEDAASRPLFLWVHLFDAHTPYEPPEAFDRLYYEADRDPFDPALPDPGVDPEILAPVMPGLRDLEYGKAQYKAEVSYLDGQLGRLFADPRFAEGTIAVVADHGEGLGESGVWFGHDELYTGTVHIPMLIAGPGVTRDLRVEEPVTHLDLGRTLLELAGLEPGDFPGESLLRFTEGSRHPPRPRFILSSGARAASVQSGSLYLVMYLADYTSGRSGRAYARHEVELFDIVADRDCRNDLVDSQPQAAAGLRALLVEWLQSAEPLDQAAAIDDPALLEQLEQLGYVASETGDGPLWVEDDCDWCRRLRR